MAKHTPPLNASVNIACSHALNPKNFLIWRIIVSIYFCSVFIWSMAQYGPIALISLTIQTLVICTAYILLSTYVTFIYYKYIHQNVNDDTSIANLKCSRYCKYTEKVQSIAVSISLTVVISFWSLLWQYAALDDPVNIQVHGTTMVFTVIDFYLCYSIISFKKTILYLIVFGIIYIVWSIIFQFITNNAIYPVMDWKEKPVGAVIVAVMVLLLAVFLHLILCWTKHKLLSKRGYYEDRNQFDIALVKTAQTTISKVPSESYGGMEQQTEISGDKAII